MKVTFLCTSPEHPVIPWLECWKAQHQHAHSIILCHDKSELVGGDVLFLVSCSQLIDAAVRSCYRHVLILHASDLPLDRGWSPHIWSLLEGAETITVSLLDAEDHVDTGSIWAKRTFSVPLNALYDEIHRQLFDCEMALIDEGILLVEAGAKPVPQASDLLPTYRRKRTPEDSEIDPSLPLKDLFNTIRIMDPLRYPAFFRLHGHTYTIELKKATSYDENGN